MKLGLFGAFAFLLGCAALYYLTQFSLVTSLGEDHRSGRERREKSWLQEQREIMEKEGLEAMADSRSRHKKLRMRSRRLRGTAMRSSGKQKARQGRAAEEEEDVKLQATHASSVANAVEDQQPQPQQPQQQQPGDGASAATTAAVTPAAVTPAAGACDRTRRPYHVVMTAASGLYQEWQSRIAYYHYLKQKRLNPCSDLGGFTRLFNTPNARPDGLMEEIPTVLVKQLGHGSCSECDRGFIVMNRPWGVVQFVESEHFRSRIVEEYIFVIETDHMMMKALVNEAQPDRPVGFGFYYMLGTDPKLKPVVQKFLDPSIDPSTVDAVGPSPILIHKPLLQKVARPWWEMSQRMQHDGDAQRVFGWVLEMWGYNLAVRNMGIRHTVSKDIQVEPQGEGTDDMDSKVIYHYTFGLTPKPVFPGAPSWRLDKRMYYGAYPSDHLSMPPACTAKSGFVIASMWNEAAQHIEGWKTRRPPAPDAGKVDDLRSRLLAATRVEGEGLGQLLRGTGPWRWGRISRFYLFSRGLVYVPGPTPTQIGTLGTWAATGEREATLTLCGKAYSLHFESATDPWTFTALLDGTRVPAKGALADVRQHTNRVLPKEATADLRPELDAARHFVGGLDGGEPGAPPLVRDVAASGPWFWAGSGPLGFLRGGVLVTPWGEGVWGLERDGGERAPSDAVFADFAGSQHTLRMLNPGCLRIRSVRKADGDIVGVDFAGTATQDTSCTVQP